MFRNYQNKYFNGFSKFPQKKLENLREQIYTLFLAETKKQLNSRESLAKKSNLLLS